MLTDTRKYPKYDLPTAVTFLFAGLALGWMTALLFAPGREDSAARPRRASARQSIADVVFLG
jgi:hypothetical protein